MSVSSWVRKPNRQVKVTIVELTKVPFNRAADYIESGVGGAFSAKVERAAQHAVGTNHNDVIILFQQASGCYLVHAMRQPKLERGLRVQRGDRQTWRHPFHEARCAISHVVAVASWNRRVTQLLEDVLDAPGLE
eukprot:CAMPEP_0181199604 /NCGR_PEP_ID=MMETSP1096-20121128/17262_1 /TAXON_ID=156174 ORGANISM="Chrysochromulina ericina, Strain CCMP281" /NCGR_SAMPLE_ID=MMETSP1096 /ASSEMBLY_ACC=CAM_ASM_000453 /LENGTH=133 /DNA_ID=CAMNT_0023289791 /DNA_START=627 /DNA_END=1029 /DNA_ORIENTATION=+